MDVALHNRLTSADEHVPSLTLYVKFLRGHVSAVIVNLEMLVNFEVSVPQPI